MSEKRKEKKIEKAKTEKQAPVKPMDEKKPEKPVGEPKGKLKGIKENTSKVNKRGKNIYTNYKIEGESLTRMRPYCERCGTGYFMADHGDRFSCGHCGFTRYKRA